MIEGVSPDLPHTDRMPATKEWFLRLTRPVVRYGLRLGWRVQVHGVRNVPRSGPVILAANHIGLLDGPALVALTRRLTFALVKREAFTGAVGQFLIHLGQISLNRREIDPQAIKRAVQVLRAGKVLAVFPEGGRSGGEVAWAKGGAAYLAMITGAPIVPVAILGTREPGQRKNQIPQLRKPIHVVYGEPFNVPRSSWPRRKAAVAKWTEVVRERLANHVVAAQAVTGLPLPGPPKIKSALSTVQLPAASRHTSP
ncbi:MAG TPA: lysophospholipid acyltransferase family protein [Propionibacteriaceae bacterium]|nr:lysophospholipid acyltransferase family protein [Propionibacteriaceae bacterium]